MLNLASPPPDFTENPFPHYDALLQNAPVCPQPDGSFIISRHADLNAIYRDTTTYISDKKQAFEPKFGAGSPLFEHHTTSLVFNDPPLHTRVRRIMSSALAPKAIACMDDGLIKTVDHLLDNMPQTPDIIEDYASVIPIQIIGNLLNIPMNERAPLRDWSLAILGALEPTLTDTQLTKGHTAVSEFKAYLQDLIARRTAHPGDPETDVLTRLIQGDTQGTLSEIELIQNCIFILNAGHETTTNLIGSGLALLHDHPIEKAKLIADPSLINTAVEEVLRMASPNQFGNRQTTSEVTLGAHKIPAGTNLHLCIGAANRDPEVFDNPTKFDISRQPNRHLAFAGGPHVCVGLTLARMEGRIAIQRFLTRYPDYKISENRKSGGRIRFHGYASLPTTLT
ncbi:cytochrome P450 [uncultured Sulfitobacter sp.]|uniref:cytochrome P450 n=1 Tax=uncultured Sulfitobacter sp. TaxID=191468 RepID=UPI002619CBCD|nr:cytochrome P450 [uncultured Sulfitobacter sp.]